MLRQIVLWVQNGPIKIKGVFPVTALLFWKFCFSLRTSYKVLIWCANDPNAYILTYSFVSSGVLFEGAFSLWVSLRLVNPVAKLKKYVYI